MPFIVETQRILMVMLVAFALVAIAAGYWAITGTNSLLLREDNPRLVEDEAALQRGAIFDQNDTLLVESIVQPDGSLERTYNVPELNGAIGYFSLRYGTDGIENAYDAILRGEQTNFDLGTFFEQDILHMPQIGTNIQVSYDDSVQREIVQAMSNLHGAAVVIDVPSGEILAMVSLPTYDPNTLDEDWDDLITAEGNPFFNRVLQGRYQSGGTFQIPLMAEAILSGYPLEEINGDATQDIVIDDVEVGCVIQPPSDNLTLTEAFQYGCPAPFVIFGETLPETNIKTILESFDFNTIPALIGFTPQIPIETTPEPEATEIPESANGLEAIIVGQSDLTVTPLNLAMVAAAIINEGNAPPPHVLIAVQDEHGEWVPMPVNQASNPMMTSTTASQMRQLMVGNWTTSLLPEASANTSFGGHAALAYSGASSQAWFVGFASEQASEGVAIAIVLEDSDNIEQVIQIGNIALQAAYSLRSE